MKRLFFALTLASCLFSLSAFSMDSNYPDALNSFYKTFQNAKNVNWSHVDDMLRIGFTQNDRQQYAYYSNDDLVVVATEIRVDELPGTLKAQLSQYKGTASHVYELVKNNAKEYCVVIDSPDRQVTLKGKSRWKFCFEEKK